MFFKRCFSKFLMLTWALLMNQSEGTAEQRRQAANTSIYWYWGDDQVLQDITQGVKQNGETLKDMGKSSVFISNFLQNISHRLNAIEETLTAVKATQELCKFSHPKSCADILRHGGVDGVYTLYTDTEPLVPLRVYCMREPGGGAAWTLIQRISSAKFSTMRSWHEYENGFGDVEHDHWLGLKNAYRLQSMWNGTMQLWLSKRYDKDAPQYAKFRNFSLGDASSSYALKSMMLYENNDSVYVDNFRHSLKQKFSTTYNNCAKGQRDEGWWCDSSHCCYGLNTRSGDLNYVHLAIRPNSDK